MPGGKRYPAGPLAYVAVGLFVMTWASIRLWQPTGEAPRAEVADKAFRRPAPSPAIAPPARPAAVSKATIATPPPVKPASEASAAKLVLEELTTMPMVAEIAPPVATRIEYDPEITLEPDFTVALEPALAPAPYADLPLMPARRAATVELDLRIAKASIDRTPRFTTAWAYPTALVADLQELTNSPATEPWATEVLHAIDELFALEALCGDDVDAVLVRLERASDDAKNVAPAVADRAQRAQLARVSYAIVRRLLVWRQVEQCALAGAAATQSPDITAQIEAAERYFAAEAAWKKFLLLDDLRLAVYEPRETQAALARRVLARLEGTQLTAQQRQVLVHPTVNELTAALASWAAEPVAYSSLLAALEQLEVGQNSLAARDVALAWQRLRHSPSPEAQRLAEQINTYYRNANVRVAISGELLNMLMPHQPATEESVNDEVLGARVFGRSQTSARLRVVLLPDMRRLRLGLEAIGEVDSDTTATKGPATLYSQGTAHFHARKMLQIDRQGLRVWRSQADVEANNYLTDVATDFDALPFVGLLARAMARQEHEDNYHVAAHEIRGKVAARAERKFDSEVHRQLDEAEREFMHKIYEPLARLKLEPTAVDMHTTREQLIARYRIAGQHQLAAFTPRPAVPGDSVLNVQLHQSTLNNVLEQLALDGRRTELEPLYRELAAAFNQPLKPETLEELPANVTVAFAERDAVRVHCDDGKLLLVLKFAELSQGRDRKWKNFTVRAYYAPDYSTLDAKLVREQTIELEGERLGFGDQIALRGIFTKVLSKNRTFNLVHEKLARDPRLAALSIGQFKIEDGWIGLSVIGPQAQQDRTAVGGESVPRSSR